jgi:hypothetical protein
MGDLLEGDQRNPSLGNAPFKTKLSDTQLWQVSQLLAHANEIPESVKKVLITDPPTSAPTPPPISASGQKSGK